MPKLIRPKNESSTVHGTRGARMPDPGAVGKGETEDRVRDAFSGRPILIPDAAGDLANPMDSDSEAEPDDRIKSGRQKVERS